MKIKVQKFQDGGAMDTQQSPEAPTQEQGAENPIMQIAQLAAQALQNQDCQAMSQVCQAFLQLIQQQQGGGEQAPAEGEPVYKKGGRLVRRIKK